MTNQSQAIAFFAERLAFQTDVSDVHAALEEGGKATAPEEGGEGAALEEGGEGTAPGDGGAGRRTVPDAERGRAGFVLVDARSEEAWKQGHIPGAIHLPHAEVAHRAVALIPPGTPVVTYCWGPACNGATRAALAFATAGFAVREMIGGIEYWVREGFPLRTPAGDVATPADPLTAPACGC